MVASVLDLRTKMNDIMKALERNEKVTLTRRGKRFAVIVPDSLMKVENNLALKDIEESPCFGMWVDREDMADPVAYVENLRKGRFDNDAL